MNDFQRQQLVVFAFNAAAEIQACVPVTIEPTCPVTLMANLQVDLSPQVVKIVKYVPEKFTEILNHFPQDGKRQTESAAMQDISYPSSECFKSRVASIQLTSFILVITAQLAELPVIFTCSLWPPYGIGQAIIFSSCSLFYLLSFFSSPNISRQRLDVYHTSTRGVALVRI